MLGCGWANGRKRHWATTPLGDNAAGRRRDRSALGEGKLLRGGVNAKREGGRPPNRVYSTQRLKLAPVFHVLILANNLFGRLNLSYNLSGTDRVQ